MNEKELEKKLSRLGFPLMETSREDFHETLAEVVKADNLRYWESFPVLLANAAKQTGFNYEKVEHHFSDPAHKEQLKQLFLMSLALYSALGLAFAWVDAWRKQAGKDELSKLAEFRQKIKENQTFEAAGRQFFAQRLKDLFANYYEQETAQLKSLETRHEALSLEYALSQLFSPKQKELFKKKLNAEPLTKTEKEYFSRTVKKKVMALANPELHRLAQRLLE